MNDKEFKEQKRRLLKLVDRWITPLGLRWWKVDIVYSRESLSTERHKEDGHICQATTQVDWEYINATITFDIQAISLLKDEELESIFVHECCHILVHEMRMWALPEMSQGKLDEAMKHEERVVTQLAKAFLWTREAGVKEGKPPRKKSKKK